MPDLRTLAIFVKVAERRSFVRAATDLGITQSGVSNAIKRLEDQVGTLLLARTTRRVSLTEDGAAFFERCRQALAAIDEAEHVLKRAQLKPSGTLRIDMPLAFGRIKLVPLLRAFQDDYPDVRLRITFTDRYIDLIEEGVDVAIRFGALQDSSLIARRLTAAQFNAAASPAYVKKFGRPKTPDDLQKHNCLAFAWRDTRQTRDWTFTVGGNEVRVTPSGTMSSPKAQRSAQRPWTAAASRNCIIIISMRRLRAARWCRSWRTLNQNPFRSRSSIRRRGI